MFKRFFPLFGMIVLLLFSCKKKDTSSPSPTNSQTSTPTACVKTNCADYTSTASAQAAYNSDKVCHGDLDADKDGTACEEPGNSVTTCSNTSNCGCSSKNKADCQISICCQWIVGDGCNCK